MVKVFTPKSQLRNLFRPQFVALSSTHSFPLGHCQSLTPTACVTDPRDRRSRGAEIEVRSTGAEKLGGLTWWQLNAVVKGLQEAMFDKGIYSEAHFKIFDGLTKVPEQGVGRLTTVRRRPTLVDANVTWL